MFENGAFIMIPIKDNNRQGRARLFSFVQRRTKFDLSTISFLFYCDDLIV